METIPVLVFLWDDWSKKEKNERARGGADEEEEERLCQGHEKKKTKRRQGEQSQRRFRISLKTPINHEESEDDKTLNIPGDVMEEEGGNWWLQQGGRKAAVKALTQNPGSKINWKNKQTLIYEIFKHTGQ